MKKMIDWIKLACSRGHAGELIAIGILLLLLIYLVVGQCLGYFG